MSELFGLVASGTFFITACCSIENKQTLMEQTAVPLVILFCCIHFLPPSLHIMPSISNITDEVIGSAVAFVSGTFEPLVTSAILGDNTNLETLLRALPDQTSMLCIVY